METNGEVFMHTRVLGQPCRNFQILGIGRFVDPRDSHEKVVLTNYAAGATGNIVIVDPVADQGEDLPLPGDNGAWASLNYRDEKLLIGTCSTYGYLHSLDLRTRAWATPLRDEHETYIWNLCLGSDGLVYGGTYPGCVLLRYDPARHTLANLGRASADPGNLYSRTVYGQVPGHILIACGYATPGLMLWNMQTREFRPFDRPGAQIKEINDRFICTAVSANAGDELAFYNTQTLEPIAGPTPELPKPYEPKYAGMSFSITLADGGRLATRGQEYYIDRGETQPPLKPIPAPRPATHILTIASDPQGHIWGSAGFGQTIFRYDPATGETWNSQVVCDGGGEAYGLSFAGGKLFLSCYAGGDHIVYDPTQPWDQIANRNPRTLTQVAPDFIRPSAKSVIGPDSNFWTGWMAKYGAYGGALSRIDTATMQMTCWPNPAGPQALVGLAAGERYLYFTTGGGANGLPSRVEPFHFAVVNPAGEIVWRHAFDPGVSLGPVAAVQGNALVAVDKSLQVYNPHTFAFERAIPLSEPCQFLLAWQNGQAAVFCGQSLLRVNPLTGNTECLCELPGSVHTATVTPDGALYFAHGTFLYQVQP
jgi:hypothetical protein